MRSTTIVDATYAHGAPGSATGFFFSPVEDYSHVSSQSEWRTLATTWIVTNRHVLLPKVDGLMGSNPARKVTFRTRTASEGRLSWNEHNISEADLGARARFHPDKRVDVAAIDITDMIGSIVESCSPLVLGTVTSHELVGGDNPVNVETGSDVLVAGFPYGFHDADFLFPVVKSGIVASAWRLPWNGQPCFLIDARLFPGSSGSLVTTTPQQFAVVDGMIRYTPAPVVSLLGVYSGAFQVPTAADDDDPLDLGVVWYAETISQVIADGVDFGRATSV